MDLSLVIICCDDPHVFRTIDSVDVKVPVIVSLVPNRDLEASLRARGVKVTHSIRGNYSVSCNRGLEVVQTGRAFIVDSDCTLAPGCLTRIDALLDEAPLARAIVNFESSLQTRLSEHTARIRNLVNNRQPIPAYTPGLGFRLDIVSELGGYFFDERIFWSCDSELNRRVQRAGFPIEYSPDAVISHKPISLLHELYSGFKLGMGNRAQVKLGLRRPYENPDWIARRLVNRLKKSPILRRTCHEREPEDLPTRLIRCGWKLAFHAGYYRVFFRCPESIGYERC